MKLHILDQIADLSCETVSLAEKSFGTGIGNQQFIDQGEMFFTKTVGNDVLDHQLVQSGRRQLFCRAGSWILAVVIRASVGGVAHTTAGSGNTDHGSATDTAL